MPFDNTIFANSTLVDSIPKNKLEELRISRLKNDMVDARLYFYFPNEKEPKPTKKGVWIAATHLPKIIEAFEKLKKDESADFCLELEKSKETEQLRVHTAEFRGNKLIHIRTFYLKEGEFQPGRGVSFTFAMLSGVIEALKKAETIKVS